MTRAWAMCVIVLLAANDAHADVASLRAPSAGRNVSMELGFPKASLGVWLNDWLAIGAFARIPLSSVGAQLGLRRTFLGDLRDGWGLDGIAAFGVEFTTVNVALVADATGSIGVRYFGPAFVLALRATAPVSFRLTDELQVKVPVLGELWLGGRAGGVWVTLHGAAGASFLAGYQPTPSVQLGVVIVLEF